MSRGLAAAAGALAAFAGWSLASMQWSNAPARALLEYDRALLYAAVAVIFGLAGRRPGRARWLVLGLAVATLAIAAGALATWFAPDRFPVDPSFLRRRLSWPASYWNATGLLAGLGVIWNLHVASAPDLPRPVRMVGATAVPLLAATLLITASRGAVLATAVGVVGYLVAGASWRLAVVLAGVVPASAVALAVANHTAGLNAVVPGGAAVHDGHRALAVIAVCGLGASLATAVLGPLERRALRLALPRPSRRALAKGSIALAVALATGSAAFVASGSARTVYDQFVVSQVPVSVTPGGRLRSFGNDNRLDHWRVAMRWGFDAHPLYGTGAGTYALLWAKHRNSDVSVLDAHSLYVEQLGELGLVGLALLVVCLLAFVVALVRRVMAGGAERAAWAALLAATLAWLAHAALDYDWELPAVTLWLFAAGGLALSAPAGRRGGARWWQRAVPVLACAALIPVPLAIGASQRHLNASAVALAAGDCPRAMAEARKARAALDIRPEPYQLLAYCLARGGDGRAARAAIDRAVRRDPASWESRYDRAVADAAGGRDPWPSLLQAHERDPRNPDVALAQAGFARSKRSGWRRVALSLPLVLPPGACGRVPRPGELCGAPPPR